MAHLQSSSRLAGAEAALPVGARSWPRHACPLNGSLSSSPSNRACASSGAGRAHPGGTLFATRN